jgi:hypothetical protein
MKITKTKIIRELEKNYNYVDLNEKDEFYMHTHSLIRDTLEIVDKILKEQKGISIK